MNIIFKSNDITKKGVYEAGFKMSYDDIKFVNENYENNDNENNEIKENSLTVIVDELLYIDGLKDEHQPGLNYKLMKDITPEGNEVYKKVSDEEIINHYSNIVSKLGGKANAKFIDQVKLEYKGKVIKEFNVENPAIFTANASKTIKKGSPLSSITLIPEFGDIYKSECDDNEEELLFETRDKKAIKTIAKEVSEIKDYLHNEIN